MLNPELSSYRTLSALGKPGTLPASLGMVGQGRRCVASSCPVCDFGSYLTASHFSGRRLTMG